MTSHACTWEECASAVDAWLAGTGARLAERGMWTEAREVGRQLQLGVLAGEGAGAAQREVAALEFELVLPLLKRALERKLGTKLTRARPPFRAGDGASPVYWNVELPPLLLLAAPFPAPPPRPVVRRNRKEVLAARATERQERGLASRWAQPKDPLASQSERRNNPEAPRFCRYVDEFLRLTCAPALLELRLFPNAKEISESLACFNAARRHLADAFRPDDPSVMCMCVGDGITPRTAALFAFRTSWTCVSVDPIMQPRTHDGRDWGDAVRRLRAERARVEDMSSTVAAERVLLVLPHAHVSLSECLRKVRWSSALAVIGIPCCNNYRHVGFDDAAPLFEEDDLGIVSPHNLVRVWSFSATDCLPLAVPPPYSADDSV